MKRRLTNGSEADFQATANTLHKRKVTKPNGNGISSERLYIYLTFGFPLGVRISMPIQSCPGAQLPPVKCVPGLFPGN